MKTNLITRFSSKHNGKIELIQKNGAYSIVVDQTVQSGELLEALWEESFEKLLPKEITINNILILGFGAGSVMTPLRERWPKARVEAVEIDQTMIKIAKRYFPENLKGVNLSKHDGIKYIQSLEKKTTYDLVLVDCYIGNKQPGETIALNFMLDLKKIAQHVLLNQLFLPQQKGEMKKVEFLLELDKIYPVNALKLPYNIIISF